MAVSSLEIPGKILVRGFHVQKSIHFPQVIHQLVDTWQDVLKALGVQRLNSLQERITFALDAGLDVYVAGPKQGGKRTAYLIPVLEYVLTQLLRSTEEERVSAPASIIVCESVTKGIELRTLLKDVINNFTSESYSSTNLKVAFVDNIHNEAMLDSMAQPLDILILTGAALQELLTAGYGPMLESLQLKYHRTRYLIFEELAMKQFFLEKELINFLTEVYDKVAGKTILQKLPCNVQLIFSGTTWSHDYIGSVRKKLCTLGRKSVMIFGSTQHALQFSSSVKWKVDHVTSDKEKLNLLIGICKGMLIEKRKVVVACSTPDMAVTVGKYISENGGICNNVITWGKKESSGIFRRNTDWLGSVFVVSDNAWEEFEEYDASCLIHFDIDLTPGAKSGDDDTKPFCHERFSCMWLRMERTWHSTVEPHGLTHFFLSGNEPNFLAFHKFLQTVDIPLPQSLEEIAEQKSQKALLSMPLCKNLKCFAYCNVIDCPSRHAFSQEDLDIEPNVPVNGELEFKVIRSINPSFYVAKILNLYAFDENTGEKMCTKSYREEARERILEMMDYYSIQRNRIHPLKVRLGEVFCIPYSCETSGQNQYSPLKLTMYLRAKLDKFVYESGTSQLSRSNDIPAEDAEMYLLDFGTTMTIPVADLMVIPEQFQKWKPHCIQVVLSNLLYLEETREYYSDALEAAQRLTEGKVWHGKVLLSVRDTVWVNPMVQYEKDPVTGHLTLGLNLMAELISGNYATLLDHHKHMMMMLEYIQKQDPKYPEIEHEMNNICWHRKCEQEFHKQGDHIPWAELPLSDLEPENDNRQLSKVSFKILSCITPWEIYGTVCTSASKGSISLVEEDLTREVDRGLEIRKKNFCKYAALLAVGSVAAIKVKRESRWQRGLILWKYKVDGEMCHRFNVFLVDYGLIASDLRELVQVVPLPKAYVEVMPFQAICLQLAHIHPAKGKRTWEEKEIGQFLSILSANKDVSVIAFTEVEGVSYPCKYYKAMAYWNLEDNGCPVTEIGVQLVKKQFAEFTAELNNILKMIRLIKATADDTATVSENSSESSSISDDEHRDTFINDDDIDDEDGDSETSLERWKRFSDVEMESGEYVALANDGSEFFENPTDSAGRLEANQNLTNIFRQACNFTGLTVIGEQREEFVNIGDDNGFENGGLEEEFFDALEDEVDNDGGHDFSPEEEAAMFQLTEQFLNTL